MTDLECPKCGTALNVSGLRAGAIVTCRECGNVAAVPRSSWWSPRGVALALGLLFLCPCVGVLSAIAIPKYRRFPVRAKQAECKSNLRALYKAQQEHLARHGTYEPRLPKAGFIPEAGNRYAYFTGAGPLVPREAVDAPDAAVNGPEDAIGIGVDRSKDTRRRAVTLADLPWGVAQQVGVKGTCPDCNITIACAGDIDIDDTVDVWLISSESLLSEDGDVVPPGIPTNVVSDVYD